MRLFSTLSALGFTGLLLAGCTINGNPFDFGVGGTEGDDALIECVAANATAAQLAGLSEREALDRAIALCLGEEEVPPEDCYDAAYAACVAEGGDTEGGDTEGNPDPDSRGCEEVAQQACDDPPEGDCYAVEFAQCVEQGGSEDWCAAYAGEVCVVDPTCEEAAYADCLNEGIDADQCEAYVAEVCGDIGPSCEETAFEACQELDLNDEQCAAYVAETCGDGGGGDPTCEDLVREQCALEDLDDEACTLRIIETCSIDPGGVE